MKLLMGLVATLLLALSLLGADRMIQTTALLAVVLGLGFLGLALVRTAEWAVARARR